MFAAIYQFDVHAGREAELEAAWAELTAEIRRARGSLGSHLFREAPQTYVAVALWPDRATYDAPAPPLSPAGEAARARMRAACAEVRTLHLAESVADLWARPAG